MAATTGGQDKEQLVAHQFGLIGALICALTKKRRDQKASAARQSLDATHPLQLVTQHKHSFQVHRTQITEQSLEAPSPFKFHGPYAARWKLNVSAQGRLSLELPTNADVNDMVRLLRPIMESTLRVPVEWNVKKNRYMKRAS